MGKSFSPSAFNSATLIVRMDAAMALRRAWLISSMFIVSNDMMLGSVGVLAEQKVRVRRLFQTAHLGALVSVEPPAL